MFNTFHGGTHTSTTNINAVTGAILRNHPKSWFERFHLKSERANQLLVEGGHEAQKKEYYDDYHISGLLRMVHDPDKDIVVLQMVICGDMEVLAECVYKKDLEEATTND